MSDPADQYTQFITSGAYKNVFDYNGQRSEMYYIPQVSQLPAEVHPTQWIGDRSVDFLRDCDASRPFFLVSSFIHPHPPFAPPAPWNKMYRTVSDDPYMPEDPAEFAAFMSEGRHQPSGSQPAPQFLLCLHLLCGLSDQPYHRYAEGTRAV